MKKYSYIAKNNQEEISKGVIDSESQDLAAEAITAQSLTPISVKEVDNSFISKILSFNFINAQTKVMFAKELATLVSAGIPISQAMHILEDQQDNKAILTAVKEISSDIESGLSLSVAMEKQGRIFSPLYASMIRAGEVAGILDETLERIADEIENDHALSSKIKGAMAYPVIILVAMVGVVIYMLQTIIPQVAQIFTDMGGKLPAATQFLMNLSYAIKHYGVIIAVVLVGIAFGARALVHNNPTIRYWWHFIILKIPLSIGKLAKQINTVRFTRTLGSLLTSGVTVLEALEITADTVPNDVFKKEIRAAAEKVKNGSTLAEPIKGSRVVFDPIVAQMISVGEETGSLDKILLKVTTFYEREVENKVNNLETLIQPLLMMLIGAGVGFIIISVVQPIYSISNLF